MPSRKEQLKNDWETIKSLKGRKRWDHIWEYYRIIIIGFVIFLLIMGSVIYNIVNPPPAPALIIAWTYGFQLPEFYDAFTEELADRLLLDPKKYTLEALPFFTTGDAQLDMANIQRFAAMITIGDLDIVVGTQESIETYAYQELLIDIQSLLPAGAEGLLWAEGVDGISSVYGVSILNSQILENADFFYFDEWGTPYLGVFVNASRMENIKKAIEILLN